MQATWIEEKARPGSAATKPRSLGEKGRRPLVYGALVAFSALYYYRPEDFIPWLGYVPMAKIAAIIGVIALIGGASGRNKIKVPTAVKVLLLLLLQMSLAIPFAIWRGGAFATVFDKFSKGVIVALLVSTAVVTVKELRKLLWIQVSAVALVTFVSIVLRHHDVDGRLTGVQYGILENPNDLAINIAISFPIVVAFLLGARGWRKAIWGAAIGVMCLGIVLTYSRSGLLAFLLTVAACVWKYGIKGKRHYIVAVAGGTLVLGMALALSMGSYRARVESIFLGNVAGSNDKGSLEARKQLLKKSVLVAVQHPIFGVGPGCFPLVDQGWRVAHNSYTELAAEAGFPALILFLLAIGAAFKNLSKVRASEKYNHDVEFRVITQAVWAALVAYLLGSAFASTEYNLYPYFMVGYTCAMVRIAAHSRAEQAEGNRSLNKTPYGSARKPQIIWNR